MITIYLLAQDFSGKPVLIPISRLRGGMLQGDMLLLIVLYRLRQAKLFIAMDVDLGSGDPLSPGRNQWSQERRGEGVEMRNRSGHFAFQCKAAGQVRRQLVDARDRSFIWRRSLEMYDLVR